MSAGQAAAGVTLLFTKGERPSADEIALYSASLRDGEAGGFTVSHVPADAEGWVELLANGLTFDLAGLAPGPASSLPPRRHTFGLDGPELPDDLEALHLAAGPHLETGGAMLPVVKAMTGIAARLAGLGGVRAICWNPAGTCLETALFVRLIGAWLDGGPFPALGLTALVRGPDGGLLSDGLAWFVGQELWIEAAPEEAPGDTARLAVRLIDHLVAEGGFHSVDELIAPDGTLLNAEPSRDGSVLRIWRRS